MLPSDEDSVIQRIVDGQTELFRILVERYQRSLFRFVANLVTDGHQSEDITQEVFLTAFRNLGKYDARRASFSTWLFTIARNQAVNWLNRKRPILPGSFDQFASQASVRDTSTEDFLSDLDDVLAKLPTALRAAFVLAEIEGFSYEEIAAIERAPLGTIKSRINRARQKLQSLLAKEVEHS